MKESLSMSEAEKILCNPTVLRDAIAEVFNSMVFMEVSPECELVEHMDTDEESIMGTITFTGVFEGALSIRCGMECAKEITMNLLAFEDEDEMEESDIPDAIGEVSNMTMGTIKSMLYEQVGEISVSVPTVVSGSTMVNRLRAGEVKLAATVAISGQYCIQADLLYLFTGEK